jgi:sterol desaturase/sphingolipid hydroxylase (fatty acid hydroxylase superfamily)
VLVLRSLYDFCSAHPTSTQIAFYAAILGGLWFAEYKSTGQALGEKTRHAGFNATLLLLALPAQLAMMAVVVALAHWSTVNHVGLLYLLPGHDTVFVKYGVMFLVMDLLDYAYHYAAHQVPWLWRLHLVHHSDRDVDVSTTFREHPMETLVRTATLCVWVVLCGATLPLLLLRQSFESIANIGQHCRLELPEKASRILRYVLVTPDMHRTHHHAYLPGTDSNYGDVLSFWDRLFGTMHSMPRGEIRYGVDTHFAQDRDLPALLGLKAPRENSGLRVADASTAP